MHTDNVFWWWIGALLCTETENADGCTATVGSWPGTALILFGQSVFPDVNYGVSPLMRSGRGHCIWTNDAGGRARGVLCWAPGACHADFSLINTAVQISIGPPRDLNLMDWILIVCILPSVHNSPDEKRSSCLFSLSHERKAAIAIIYTLPYGYKLSA